MTARTEQNVTSSGITPTAYAASAGGDTVPADVIVQVFNASASPITLTLVTPGSVDGDLAVADRTVTVAAAVAGVPGRKFVRPTRVPYGQGGLVTLTWSTATDVSFEVIK